MKKIVRWLGPGWIAIVFILILGLMTCRIAEGDVAPGFVIHDGLGAGSNSATMDFQLTNHTDIYMTAFFVNVSVNLPTLHEVYTYHLHNPLDRSINQSVVIPITFDTRYMVHRHYGPAYGDSSEDYDFSEPTESELYEGSDFQIRNSLLTVNGMKATYTECDIQQPVDDSDIPHEWDMYGYATTIYFEPNSTTVIRLEFLRRIHGTYIRDFTYFYSARTGGLWNGTIDYGYFHLRCEREYEWVSYYMPNPVKDPSGLMVISEVWNTEGGDYRVKIREAFILKLGDHKYVDHPIYMPRFPPKSKLHGGTLPTDVDPSSRKLEDGSAEVVEEPHTFVLNNPLGLLMLAVIMFDIQIYIYVQRFRLPR